MRPPAILSLILLLIVAAAHAQQPNAPHAGYVYPAGGQQGTTVRVQVGGRFLDGVDAVVLSGRDVQARVITHDKPLTGQQLTDLRDKAQELQKKGAADPAVRKELLDIRMRVGDSVRRNANPALGEIVTLEITISPDAEPGSRQLRLATPLGLTNPLVFVVGQLPECREKDLKNGRADAELAITLPATVNGRIIPGDVDRLQFPARQPGQYMPGDVDRYRFTARKGQDLVIAASARDLMPYLADAVPGWFQATLTLFDAAGHELAYDDDFRFQPDPVLHYRIPGDGEYALEIKDALYRGREDFVYRITIGEVPFVTGIFPLGGRAGARTEVEVTGWNLPSNRLAMDTGKVRPGIYPVSMHAGALASNRVPFSADTLPEAFEREPNNVPAAAQRVALPVIVNGRVGQPGDEDVFSFAGRAGDEVIAEVSARRLASPLDSVLELVDASGRRLAFNDDHDDKRAGLTTHQADSLLTVTLPTGGTYFLRLADAQHKGGPEYAYRLRISPPQPDFDLRVSPSSINVSGGGTVPVTVSAIRKDAFSGDILLALKDAPAAFSLSGAVVPAGQDQVRLTLTVPPAATREPFAVCVEGRAAIQGKTVVREATAADEMMQAFAYRHLVPADGLRVFVTARGGTRVPSRILATQPVRIPSGGSARVRVAFPPAYGTFEHLQFELSDPPDGITIRDASSGRTDAEFVLEADAAKARPGLRGNLIVTISGERSPNAGRGQTGQAAQAVRRRVQVGTLPAIAFEVLAPR